MSNQLQKYLIEVKNDFKNNTVNFEILTQLG